MEWLLLIVLPRDAPPGEEADLEEMGAFAGEVAEQGSMRGAAALLGEEEGARVSVRGGRASVTDGPFAESKEVVGGFFAIDADTREDALAIAWRCPHARAGMVELRAAPDRDVTRSAEGTHFMLILWMSPELRDPDGSKYREMVAFDGELKRESSYLESASLPLEPPPARIGTRGGRTTVTDGPFAEAKEIIGGYYLVEAPTRDAANEIAGRCPHARWGAIEVREVMDMGELGEQTDD